MDEMKLETLVVPFREAGLLQMNAAQFNCKIKDLAVAGGENARVSIEGTPESLERLKEYVNGALSDESKKAPTV